MQPPTAAKPPAGVPRTRRSITNEQPATAKDLNPRGRPYGPVRLPVNGFTYYPTLSSKCFSTFPHGTCLLSDSQRYLALDGVYHPLRAAFSNNPTPESALDTQLGAVEALHPLWDKPRSGGLKHLATRQRHSQTPHFPKCHATKGFGAGLFPFHSPLLRESLLVSFPPLNDMLKFSG